LKNSKDFNILQNLQPKNDFKLIFCELWSRFGKKCGIDFCYQKSNIINQFC
jgi:hypothetical protein